MAAPKSLVEQVRREAVPGWKLHGMAEPGVTVRKVLELSQAQCDALAELTATLSPHHRLQVQQTWTESGGTHLYVRSPVGDEYHIASAGKVQKLGAVD